jgi:hypothetical protein
MEPTSSKIQALLRPCRVTLLKRICCISHVLVTRAYSIIERDLVKDGRLLRLRVHLADYPGALHRLTGVLAEQRTNIVGKTRATKGC